MPSRVTDAPPSPRIGMPEPSAPRAADSLLALRRELGEQFLPCLIDGHALGDELADDGLVDPVFDCGRAQRLDFADALPFGLDRLFPRGGQGLFVHNTGIRARVLRGRLFGIAGFSFCGLIARTASITPGPACRKSRFPRGLRAQKARVEIGRHRARGDLERLPVGGLEHADFLVVQVGRLALRHPLGLRVDLFALVNEGSEAEVLQDAGAGLAEHLGAIRIAQIELQRGHALIAVGPGAAHHAHLGPRADLARHEGLEIVAGEMGVEHRRAVVQPVEAAALHVELEHVGFAGRAVDPRDERPRCTRPHRWCRPWRWPCSAAPARRRRRLRVDCGWWRAVSVRSSVRRSGIVPPNPSPR